LIDIISCDSRRRSRRSEKPPLAENPTDGDERRIIDILFGSKFTTDKNLWNDAKRIYKANGKYLLVEWLKAHSNALLNILFKQYRKFIAADSLIIPPESVKQRSLHYIQESLDIHNIFVELFEKRNPLIADTYQKFKKPKDGSSNQAQWLFDDTDWKLTDIMKQLKSSNQFRDLIHKSRTKKTKYTDDYIVDFFQSNFLYKPDCYTKTAKNGRVINYLRDWRRKQWDNDDIDDDDDDFDDDA